MPPERPVPERPDPRPFKPRLLAPGPVEVPPVVLEAMARPVLHHRTPAFRELFLRARARLAEAFVVPGDALILAGSGTAAFEAGLLAAVPAGATVVAARAGKFGERWAELARTFGYRVVEVEAPWGASIDPQAVADALRANPDARAVVCVHSETSTGALHDVRAVAEAARGAAPDALVLVDAVTSLAVSELLPLAWGLDGVFSGSQKGLMLPPGLGFAWLSERAWAAAGERPAAYYLDLRRERAKQADGQTAYTPAVNLVAALDAALELLLADGLEPLQARRRDLNGAVLAGAAALGCEPYAERPSPAVAALRAPSGTEAPSIVRAFARRGIRIAGGQDHAKPVLFRPSVLGWCDRWDAVAIVACLEEALRELGREVEPGVGVAATLRALPEVPPDAPPSA